MLHVAPRPSRSHSDELGVSFEFFPPKTAEMEAQLWDCVERLAPLDPSFVSVTYGAGGSTREEVDDVVRCYQAAGVRHIVALRGDPQGGLGTAFFPHPGGYAHSTALIEGIRAIGNFEILV